MKFSYDPADVPERVHPPEGACAAVCVDFIDLGVVEGGKFGAKHKVQFDFQTPHRHPDQAWPLRVSSRFNVSLHPDSNLRQFLDRWNGKRLPDDVVKGGIDPESYVGRPAYIFIERSEDGKWSNITNIAPLPPGMQAPTPDDSYQRVKDRNEGWDVRSPNSKATPADEPEPEPAMAGDSSFPGDGLPF